jgi:hypothetical protein
MYEHFWEWMVAKCEDDMSHFLLWEYVNGKELMKYTILLLWFTENIAIKYCCSKFYTFELSCVVSCVMIRFVAHGC